MLHFADSFSYATAQLGARWSLGGVASAVSSGGRFGGRYATVRSGHTNNWGVMIRSFPQPPDSTILIQFGYLCTTAVPYRIITFGDGSVDHCYLRHSGGFLYAHHYDGTELGHATVPIANASWQQFEIRVVIGDSPNGEVYVKVDGQVLLNLTSKDTRNGGTAYCTRIYIGGFEANQASNPEYFSDFIIMDTAQVGGQDYCNSLLGVRQVKPCLPTSNGTYADYTPLSGNNYENVDDDPATGPDGDTTYNSTPDVGDKDTFNSTTDVLSGATVDAVVCSMYAKNADPVGSAIKGYCKSGASEGEGSEVMVPSSYSYVQSVIYVDPATGVPFTSGGFNSAEFGYKRSL